MDDRKNIECDDCGEQAAADEAVPCDDCGRTLCGDCRHECGDCHTTLCGDCRYGCVDCGGGLHAPVVMTTQRAAAMESIRRWRADAGCFHVMSVAVVRADIPERCLTGDGDLDGLAWSLIGAHAHARDR